MAVRTVILICLYIMAMPFTTLLARADIIETHAGEKLTCNLIRWSPYVTEIAIYGVKKQIQTNSIKKLITEQDVEVKLTSGEVAIGKIIFDSSTISVASFSFGIVHFPEGKQVGSMQTTLTTEELFKNNSNIQSTSEQSSITGEGKAPPLDYLRGTTILRSPGEIELTYSFNYQRSRNQNYVLEAFTNEIFNRTVHKFSNHIGLSAGLLEDIEGWLDIPFSYTSMEQVENSGEFHKRNSNFNIGNISAGLSYQILRERHNLPAITASIAVSAPTGDSPYKKFPDGAVASGNGHWGVAPSIGFVSTIDPIVLFCGVGYDYYFSTTYNGYRYAPGAKISYYAGMGFAVNDTVSLTMRVFGAHEFDYKVDNKKLYGTSKDPFSLGFGLSYRIGNGYILSPNVSIGANADAPDFDAGFSISKVF